MREQGDGGRIICVGSPTGQVGNFGQTNYAAAKAGIVGMVRTWSMELARAGVTVNAMIPVAATGMTETVPFLKTYVDALRPGRPLPPYARRELGFGCPEDAAGLVVFLASDEAASVTGQAIGAAVTGSRCGPIPPRQWCHSPTEAGARTPSPRRGPAHSRSSAGRRPEVPGAVLMSIDLTTVTAIDTHVHIEADGHGLRAGRGTDCCVGRVLQGRPRPHAQPAPGRGVLPLTQDGGRGIHRRRPHGSRAPGAVQRSHHRGGR